MPEDRIAQEVHLASRPSGRVSVDDFVLVEVPVPDPGPGQVLVRNQCFSFGAGLRVMIDDSFQLPLQLLQVGEALPGQAIGEVVASGDDRLPVGQLVAHGLSWREYALGEAPMFEALPSDVLPSPIDHLGGGLTAYVGLDLADLRPGETVFVSSAAGAVGSLAGQMARLRGAGRVIGSAGSAAKVAMLTGELGFDAAFDYHEVPVSAQLNAAAPDGVDVYFDNTGGEQLEAAIEAMNPLGRIMICGWLATQTDDQPAPPLRWNQALIINKRVRVHGFSTLDHMERQPDYLADFGRWLRSGEIRVIGTTIDGLAAAPQAFCDYLAGRYAGRVAVRLP
jgi:NADPH-dependent curcumin reductase CurA